MPRGVYERKPWMKANSGKLMHQARPDTVRYLYGMGLTYSQIGSALGVSKSTIGRYIGEAGPDGLTNGVIRCHPTDKGHHTSAHRQAIGRSVRAHWKRRKENDAHANHIAHTLVQTDAPED